MAWGDMMGGAMGAAMGGGNGGSFAQKRPMMQGMMKQQMRPQMGGGFGQGMMKQQPPMTLGPKTRQMQQNYQQQSPEMKDWMMRRPPVGIAPLQGEAKDRWNQSYRDWQSQMPQQGGGMTTPFNKPGPNYRPMPGYTPQPGGFGQMMDQIRQRMGGNTGIAGGMNRGGFGTPPYFPQQGQGPIGANDAPPSQQQGGGFQDMLRQIMGQFGQQGGGMQTQGGPANDPRWSNGTWGGQRPGIGPRIAPQMSMMPQMMQQPQQPQQEEEAYY